MYVCVCVCVLWRANEDLNNSLDQTRRASPSIPSTFLPSDPITKDRRTCPFYARPRVSSSLRLVLILVRQEQKTKSRRKVEKFREHRPLAAEATPSLALALSISLLSPTLDHPLAPSLLSRGLCFPPWFLHISSFAISDV